MRAISNFCVAIWRSRKTTRLAILAAATFAIACGDSTTTTEPPSARSASTDARQNDGLSGSGKSTITSAASTCVQALQRLIPLRSAVTYTKVISSNGGKISVPEADFELDVPSGAFDGKAITFTVTAYAGSTIAYDFQPHGIVFRKPLKAIQHLDHTNWGSQKLPNGYFPSLTGAYFSDTTKFNLNSGWGIVDEFESTQLSDGGRTVIWDIPHFSGYIVASGRQ